MPEDLTRARGYAFQVTHVVAVVRRPQFLCYWQDMFNSSQPGPLHRLSVLRVSQLISSRASDPRESKEEIVLPFMTYSPES